LTVVSELYRTAVDYLQVALNLDPGLSGSTWLYGHVSASHFVAAGRWPSVGEVYRSATREFAVADSYESVLAAAVARAASDGHANGAGEVINGNSAGEGIELRLTIDQCSGSTNRRPTSTTLSSWFTSRWPRTRRTVLSQATRSHPASGSTRSR